MIALDTNILISILVSSDAKHEQTCSWIESSDELLTTTSTNIAEFLRLTTHPRVFSKPLKLEDAISVLDKFFKDFSVLVLEESQDWWHDLIKVSEKVSGLRGNDIFDARIALCLKHNGVKTIASFDSDFEKYKFVKRIVP